MRNTFALLLFGSLLMLAACSAPPKNLTWTLDPSNATVKAGGAVTLTVKLEPQNLSGTINFALENLAGTATLSPSSVTVVANQAKTETFTLQTAANIAPGTFPFTIAASVENFKVKGVFNLTVVP
jgi:uncharacterized membrane protein